MTLLDKGGLGSVGEEVGFFFFIRSLIRSLTDIRITSYANLDPLVHNSVA